MSISTSLFFGITPIGFLARGSHFLNRAAPRKLWIPCLQLAACPADALKARQTDIFVLRHYLRKRHCSCILQTGITKYKIQHHIIISGIFILFQNSPDFLFNGFKVSHLYLHKGKGGIFQPPKPLTYSFCYGYSAIPPHPQ